MPRLSLLTESTCVEVRGADAAAFLHAQLSQTIVPGAATSAPLAGWLDARGRVRALFRVWPQPDRWLLATPRDGVDDLLKRLRMFVLRSAVTLRIADDVALAALLDATPDRLAARGLLPSTARGTVIAHGDLHWLCVGTGYWQVLGPSAAVAALEPEIPRIPPAAAALAEIRLGLPAITPPLVDRFVAQMLNLDVLGATAFDKGCYPGQEIVARAQYRGEVKRRMVRRPAPAGAELRPGQEFEGGVVVDSAGGELLAVLPV
jgi:folate-binding protein YgfZ